MRGEIGCYGELSSSVTNPEGMRNSHEIIAHWTVLMCHRDREYADEAQKQEQLSLVILMTRPWT